MGFELLFITRCAGSAPEAKLSFTPAPPDVQGLPREEQVHPRLPLTVAHVPSPVSG